MLALAIPFAGAITVALTLLHIVICIFLILVVLLQRGRSQDLASAFGGGQTQSNMAAMSTDDFLTRATKVSAFLFMGTSLALALFAQGRATSVLDIVPEEPPAAEDQATTGEPGATDPAAESAIPATPVPGGSEAVPGGTDAVPGGTDAVPGEPAPSGDPVPEGTTAPAGQ
jgi:preprotein translocase subunit SecG